MKIAVNRCFGGFSLTKEVYEELGIEWDDYGFLTNEDLNIESENDKKYRSDERLIKAIENIGTEKSSGMCSNIAIVSIPDDVEWEIEEYDGQEWVSEKHRTW